MCKLKNISVYKFISTIMWISAANFKQLKTVLYNNINVVIFQLYGAQNQFAISVNLLL